MCRLRLVIVTHNKTQDTQHTTLQPAVNRYTRDGQFEPHKDGYSITLNVLLDASSFEGGGTAFWRESTTEELGPVLRLEPEQGCGVVFNGAVRHSGAPVISGVRFLYVASFDLDETPQPMPQPPKPGQPGAQTPSCSRRREVSSLQLKDRNKGK